MQIEGLIRRAWHLLLVSARLLAWLSGTCWIGVRFIWRCGIVLAHLDELVSETLCCPRRHASPVFGVFECRCGAMHEGWAFGRCDVCKQSAGWTPCVTCGLPVRNPLRRWTL